MNQLSAVEKTTVGAGITQLDQLKQLTKIVADSGDYSTLKEYEPEDATTNPSLILKVAQMPVYAPLVDKAVQDNRKTTAAGGALLGRIMDDLLVSFGVEILKVVPGRVSTETNADLAFDSTALVDKARRFIALYQARGIPRERVLIKIAATWEGVQAAQVLQKEGINCNMTLLFSLPQAIACAEANAKLISPFVGRILDWFKAKTGKDYAPEEDPGVLSVKEIYAYYKHHGYQTEVMGASFRNKGEILALAGCDALTISPQLLAELKSSTESVTRRLAPALSNSEILEKIQLSESAFRWMLNESAMATEKLAEGIRAFNADALKLEALLRQRL